MRLWVSFVASRLPTSAFDDSCGNVRVVRATSSSGASGVVNTATVNLIFKHGRHAAPSQQPFRALDGCVWLSSRRMSGKWPTEYSLEAGDEVGVTGRPAGALRCGGRGMIGQHWASGFGVAWQRYRAPVDRQVTATTLPVAANSANTSAHTIARRIGTLPRGSRRRPWIMAASRFCRLAIV
jgi:hypothetical protein